MRQRASLAQTLAWSACAVLALSTSALGGTQTISYTNNENMYGQTCLVQPISFLSSNFYYQAYISSVNLASGCTSDKIMISRLFMSGTCLQERNNNNGGCSGSGQTVVTGPSSPTSYSTSDSSSLCNEVFSGQAPSGSTMNLATAVGSSFDGGNVCGPSSRGFFYLQNNCPASTGASLITLRVDITSYSGSCYYSNGLALWIKIVVAIAAVIGILAVAGMFWQRRRRHMVLAGGVQMSTPAYPPQPGYPVAQQPPPGGQMQPPYYNWNQSAPGAPPVSVSAQSPPYNFSSEPPTAQGQQGGIVTGYPKV